MIREIWKELDFKSIVQESGIFVGILLLLVCVFASILCLPFLPFYLFNEWSKTWYH